VWQLARHEIRGFRRMVQPVFQNPASSLNPRQTVGAILKAPLAVHGIGGRSTRRTRVVEAIEKVGLDGNLVHRYPHQLSGGQKQLVAIARATILTPAILLADEPTSSLDSVAQKEFLDILLRMQRELGLATVFVSHDLAVVRRVATRVAVMKEGRIVEIGPTATVLAAPEHPHTRELVAAAFVPAGTS
jgi:ABC-type microcin C transport system duplicated ATPase subunit YejF